MSNNLRSFYTASGQIIDNEKYKIENFASTKEKTKKKSKEKNKEKDNQELTSEIGKLSPIQEEQLAEILSVQSNTSLTTEQYNILDNLKDQLGLIKEPGLIDLTKTKLMTYKHDFFFNI